MVRGRSPARAQAGGPARVGPGGNAPEEQRAAQIRVRVRVRVRPPRERAQPVPHAPQGECRVHGQAPADFARWADPDGRKVLVLILDGSGGHTAKGLVAPPNVVLHRPPPCTPERQPAEHLWPLVREGLANRLLNNLDALTATLTARCQWLTEHPVVIAGAVGFHWTVGA